MAAPRFYQTGVQILTGSITGRLFFDTGYPQNTVLPLNSDTVTLNGATPVTVANANVTANSQILFTLKSVNSGTVGAVPSVKTITPGTGFTVAGTALDTGIYNYTIMG